MILPNNPNLEDIERGISDYLTRLRRPDPRYTLARTPRDDGGYHVETAGDAFAWVQTERGAELERVLASADEILFLVLQSLTRDYAQQAEMQARQGSAYSMRRWVDAHIRLMAHLDPAWGTRLEAHYEKALEAFPIKAEEVRGAMAPLDLTSFGID